jgi:fructoselysine 6-kinase
MIRLLGLGDNTVDIYIDESMQYPGGNAVNVAVHAQRLGAQASYLGCFGADQLGRLVEESLTAEGVDVSRCRRIEGPNPWSRITHVRGERVFVGSNPGVRSCYGLGTEDFAFVAGHDVVHTSVHSDLDSEISRLRGYAKLLSYDYSEYWQRPGVAETFGYVDVAFLSRPHATEGECRALAEEVGSRGPATAVVTRGAAGSCGWHRGEFYSQPAVQARVVDTLGAGDAFIAGVLVALTEGGEIALALQRGAEHAACACAVKGAFGHGVSCQ